MFTCRRSGRSRKDASSNNSNSSKRANDVKSPSEFSLPDLDGSSESGNVDKGIGNNLSLFNPFHHENLPL